MLGKSETIQKGKKSENGQENKNVSFIFNLLNPHAILTVHDNGHLLWVKSCAVLFL